MDVVVYAPDACERAVLAAIVQQAGAHAIFVAHVEAIITHWSDYAADAILLADHCDPTGLIHRICSVAIVPLIVITDALTEAQQVALYDAGASLVLPRPYSARLLAAQLRALLQLGGGMAAVADIQVDDLTLDLATRMAQRGDHVLPRLTSLEGRLLHMLMLHRGQTLPTETLIERVWGYTGEGDRNMLRKLVNRLRAKIEPDPRSRATS